MQETQELIIELPDGKGSGSLYSTWEGLQVSGLRKKAGAIEGEISGDRISLLPALTDEMELDLFQAEKEKLAAPDEADGPDLLPEESSLVIRRESSDPYWIEIETELPEWRERLSVHPQAILRHRQHLGKTVSTTFLLPASLLVIN